MGPAFFWKLRKYSMEMKIFLQSGGTVIHYQSIIIACGGKY